MAEYIEREVLKQQLQLESYCNYIHTLEDVLNIIDFVSVADVAPVVHSYWEHKIANDGENIGICHNCKYPVSWFWEQTKYCPHCGAMMDGGADHEAD